MWYFTIVATCIGGVLASHVIYYDTFKGTKISENEYENRVDANKTFWCTGAYKPCNATEGRRLDGSCNNLKYPTRGPPHTPFSRELPAVYSKDFEPRKTKSGKDLPLGRSLRTSILQVGEAISQDLSIMATHYLLFFVLDIASNHDTINFVLWNTHCCQPEGRRDPECIPQRIPNDDFVHQFSNIRCFNLTRPFTYQSKGCLGRPRKGGDRVTSASVFFDLSPLYQYNSTGLRKYKDGLLLTVDQNGKNWPVTTKDQESCLLNEYPKENLCFRNSDLNSLFPITFLSVIFWRFHNYIATELKNQNPSWSDNRLFDTARDINIACWNQIYYYELLPILMGKQNIIKSGLIGKTDGYREMYNESMVPQQSLEYSYVMRYFHSVQPGMINMYDSDGYYLSRIPVSNLTKRTGYFAVGEHMEKFTQGSFRQGAAKLDSIVDPVLSEQGLAKMQKAFDIFTADLVKGRYFGFPPYIKYRELCSGKTYKKWDDLAEDIDADKLEQLKHNYESVEDLELMAGIWLEKSMEGSLLPRTLHCLSEKQLKRNIAFDRFWYERKNRPNAFTTEQLKSIRRVTIASVFCSVGDSVTKIQPQAFLRAHSKNKMVSCEDITYIDFTPWNDDEDETNETDETEEDHCDD